MANPCADWTASGGILRSAICDLRRSASDSAGRSTASNVSVRRVRAHRTASTSSEVGCNDEDDDDGDVGDGSEEDGEVPRPHTPTVDCFVRSQNEADRFGGADGGRAAGGAASAISLE